MSLVRKKCWIVASKFLSLLTYDYKESILKKFVCPYIKKRKKETRGQCCVYITIMLILYMIPPQIDNFPHI